MANNWNPQEAIDEIIQWAKKRGDSYPPGDFSAGYDAAQEVVLDIIEEAGGFVSVNETK